MPNQTAKLSATGDQPEVELVIGHLQRGDHLIVLFDKNDANGIIVGQMNNGVPVAYRYVIPRPLSELAGSNLRWNCIIGTNSTVEENVSVTVRVFQNGKVAKGGEVITPGKVTVLGFIKGELRLDVA